MNLVNAGNSFSLHNEVRFSLVDQILPSAEIGDRLKLLTSKVPQITPSAWPPMAKSRFRLRIIGATACAQYMPELAERQCTASQPAGYDSITKRFYRPEQTLESASASNDGKRLL